MGSMESMGVPPPQQPEEELVKDKDEEAVAEEEPVLPESYNEAEWAQLKQGGEARALEKGRAMGVPQEELDRFAEEVIANAQANYDYFFVYRFRKNMGIGTEKEILDAGKYAYQFFLRGGSDVAVHLAEELYGRDSDEWNRANEAFEARQKVVDEKRKSVAETSDDVGEEEADVSVPISRNATFADLFAAIEAIEGEKGLDTLHFEEELWDNFDPVLVEEIFSFMTAQKDQAASTKVVDFFKERGYTQRDISAFLPIKFVREQKQ